MSDDIGTRWRRYMHRMDMNLARWFGGKITRTEYVEETEAARLESKNTERGVKYVSKVRREALRLLDRLDLERPADDEPVPFSTIVPIVHKLLDRIERLEALDRGRVTYKEEADD